MNHLNQNASNRRFRAGLAGVALLGVALLGIPQARAELGITDVGKGVLPNGDIIYTVKVHLDPGDAVPWHYHAGPGWAIMLSGTLTQDDGCGAPLEQFTAPQAFSEIPGKVHTAYNAGTEPVELIWTEIYPPCYDSELGFIGWIFVDGPKCEGNSGQSHLEKIEGCPDDAGK